MKLLQKIYCYSLHLAFVLAIGLVLVSLSACGGGGGEEASATLSGKVNLIANQGTAPSLGAWVAVYNRRQAKELDAVSATYSKVGFFDSQTTEFDFRLAAPVKKVSVASDGSYSVTGLSSGSYHVVAGCPGYGVKTVYNVDADQRSRAIAVTEINLYQETVFTDGQVIETAFVFERDRNYVIDGTVSITGACTIEPGTVIRINPSGKLRFYVAPVCQATQQNPFLITSNSGYNASSYPVESIANYSEVSTNGDNNISLVYGVVEYFDDFVFYAQHTQLQNMRLRASDESELLLNGEFGLEHLTANLGRVKIEAPGTCSYNMFYNCQEALSVIDVDVEISNNCIYGNAMGVRVVKENSLITHNVFSNNELAFIPNGSTATLTYNIFEDNQEDIEFNYYYQVGQITYSNNAVTSNNFMSDVIVFDAWGENSMFGEEAYGARGLDRNQTYTGNYLKYPIDTHTIFDVTDKEECWYSITVTSLARPVETAGIQ